MHIQIVVLLHVYKEGPLQMCTMYYMVYPL